MTAPTRDLIGLVALPLLMAIGGAVGAWQVQEWRYGKRLAEQANLHLSDLSTLGNAAAAQVSADQMKRLALEKALANSDQTHSWEYSNAQRNQARLRDRLATADLRLSVLLDTTDATSGCSMPATSTTGSLVHGSQRARLDPAHAQRIIGITGEGDRGLIALAACQAYAKEVSTTK